MVRLACEVQLIVLVREDRVVRLVWVIRVVCTVPKKWQTVLVNWGLKERWF